METIEIEQRPETVDQFVSIYWDKVQKIAATLAKQHGTLEGEDIAQGIWERLLPRWEKEYKELDALSVEKVLKRLGRDTLHKESLDYMYFSGHYQYAPVEVRAKLSTCTWSELDKCPDVDARVDLQGAFKQLPRGQREAVYERHHLGILHDRKSNRKRQEERGVEAITHYLNRRAPKAATLDDELVRSEVEADLISVGEMRGAQWGHGEEFGGDCWKGSAR